MQTIIELKTFLSGLKDLCKGKHKSFNPPIPILILTSPICSRYMTFKIKVEN